MIEHWAESIKRFNAIDILFLTKVKLFLSLYHYCYNFTNLLFRCLASLFPNTFTLTVLGKFTEQINIHAIHTSNL